MIGSKQGTGKLTLKAGGGWGLSINQLRGRTLDGTEGRAMTLRFITWDVEHGSAAYVRTPNGRHIAVDLGARRATDTGFSPLAHLCNTWSVKQLDAVIISHPHLDHIEDILNFDALSPKVLMRPSHLTDDEIWGGNRKASPETRRIVQKYLDIDRSYNQPTSPQTSMSLPANYGDVSFQFFTSRQCPRDNINNHSVVTVMTYQGVKFLMPGDNESSSWKELLGRQDFVSAIQNTHVLIAPHHGRESGFHAPLFERITPMLTIISDGRVVDTSATSRYSAESKGWVVTRRNGPRTERKSVTTRNDGVIEALVTPPTSTGQSPILEVIIN